MDVNVALWSDTKVVSMLSTLHSVEGEGSWVHKMRRRPRSGPSASLSEEPRESKEVPKIVDDCNKFMGGCDIVDQTRTYYSTKLTARRNWLPLFFWCLDSMVNNSYVIYKMNGAPGALLSHRDFRLRLAVNLIKEGVSPADTRSTATLGKRSRNSYVVSGAAERPLKRLQNAGRMPIAKKEKGTCYECRIKHQEMLDKGGEPDWSPRSRRGSWYCEDCNVPLCVKVDRHCYRDFHRQ